MQSVAASSPACCSPASVSSPTQCNPHGGLFPSLCIWRIIPATGEIIPLKTPSETQSLQSLEESPRSDTLQKPKPSSHWKNHPAKTSISGIKHPVTGRNTSLRSPVTTISIQRLEESPRNMTSRHADSSSSWRNRTMRYRIDGRVMHRHAERPLSYPHLPIALPSAPSHRVASNHESVSSDRQAP